ncbi:MAG: hypothetical protein ABIE74_11435 [Pseudomonadota bacterium]
MKSAAAFGMHIGDNKIYVGSVFERGGFSTFDTRDLTEWNFGKLIAQEDGSILVDGLPQKTRVTINGQREITVQNSYLVPVGESAFFEDCDGFADPQLNSPELLRGAKTLLVESLIKPLTDAQRQALRKHNDETEEGGLFSG